MLLNLRRYMRLIPSCYEGDPVVAAAYNYWVLAVLHVIDNDYRVARVKAMGQLLPTTLYSQKANHGKQTNDN